MRSVLKTLLVISVFGVSTSYAADDVLFEYQGKNYKRSDLSPAAQQQIYDVQYDSSKRLSSVIEGAVLDLYFEEQVKKTKKTRAQIEEAEMAVKDPTEKEMKEWYDKNKSRIPYPYEQIKSELKNILKREKMGKKRDELVERVFKKTKAKVLVDSPVAPVIAVNDQGYHRKGKVGAKVKIVEFADYQCPHCGEAFHEFKKIMEKYNDKIEYVYIDYPVNRSGISRKVAEAAFCAGKQKKYWEYHNAAFEDQKDLKEDSPEKLAEKIKLNMIEFKKCYRGKEPAEFVEKGKEEGDRVGVSGTPTIFINGKKTRAHDFDGLSQEIEKALKMASS